MAATSAFPFPERERAPQLSDCRDGARAEPAPHAAPPEHPAPSYAQPASPTADPSASLPLPSALQPTCHSGPTSDQPTSGADGTCALPILKLRCATHPVHGVRGTRAPGVLVAPLVGVTM